MRAYIWNINRDRALPTANMTAISNLVTSRLQAIVSESQAPPCVDEGLDRLTEALLRTHGELMSGPALYRILGFKSAGSFRQARSREHASPIPIFQIPQRRGYFALTRDAADWLYRQRVSALRFKEAPCDEATSDSRRGKKQSPGSSKTRA